MPSRRSGRYRSSHFVLPGVQLRLILWFTCAATITLVFQFLQFTNALTEALETPVEDVAELHRRLTDSYLTILVHTMAVAIPLTAAVGVLATFRLAGPLHRIVTYLRAVRDGEVPDECALRDGDELTELCDLVNEVTREQRRAPRREAA